jgi:hypothetical protein
VPCGPHRLTHFHLAPPGPPQIHAIQGDLFVNTSRAAAGVLPLITGGRLVHKEDVVVLNFGLWHGEVQRPAYIQHLHELGEFWAARREEYPWFFFMETPKQHFADAHDGDYQSSWLYDKKRRRGNHTCGPIKNVTYLQDGSLAARAGDKVAERVAAGTWRNLDARRILEGKYGMPLVPIFNTTVAAWDMHRKNYAGTECRLARAAGARGGCRRARKGSHCAGSRLQRAVAPPLSRWAPRMRRQGPLAAALLPLGSVLSHGA